MVSNSSALGLKGVHEWLLVRLTGIIIFFYIIYLLGFIVFFADPLTYEVWRGFFAKPTVKLFTVLTLFFILVHTWIGMWQVLTDYINSLNLFRFLQGVIAIVLSVYLVYGSIIVWGA